MRTPNMLMHIFFSSNPFVVCPNLVVPLLDNLCGPFTSDKSSLSSNIILPNSLLNAVFAEHHIFIMDYTASLNTVMSLLSTWL